MMQRIGRGFGIFGALLVVSLVAASCGSDGRDAAKAAQQAEPTSFTAALPATTSTMLVTIADQLGFFKEENLDVTIVTDILGAAQQTALASGDVQIIGLGVADGARLRQTGLKLQAVSGLAAKPPYSIVVPPDSDIPVAGEGGATWKDVAAALEGRTGIGTFPGTILELMITRLMRLAGVEPKFVSLPIAGGPQIAALQSGQGDFILAGSGIAFTMVNSGNGKVALDLSSADAPPEVSGAAFSAFFSSDKFLAAHPTFADRFRRAISAARSWANDEANKEKLVDVVSKWTSIPTDDPSLLPAIRYELRAQASTLSRKSIEAAVELYISLGQIKRTPPVDIDELMCDECVSK